MCSAPKRLLIWYATQKMCTLNQYLSILRISRCAYAQHLKYMLWAYDIRNIYYLPIQMCICSASVMRSITCDQQYVHNMVYTHKMCIYAQHLWYDVCEHVNMLTISIKMWCTGIYHPHLSWDLLEMCLRSASHGIVCMCAQWLLLTAEVYEITCRYHPASEEWSNNYLPRKTRYHSCLKSEDMEFCFSIPSSLAGWYTYHIVTTTSKIRSS